MEMIEVERKREESLLKFKRETGNDETTESRIINGQTDLTDVEKILIQASIDVGALNLIMAEFGVHQAYGSIVSKLMDELRLVLERSVSCSDAKLKVILDMIRNQSG